MKALFLFIFLSIHIPCVSQNEIRFNANESPQIFGPGIISDGLANRDMAISPDGMDLLYTIQWYFGLYSVIMHTHKLGGQWSKPDTAWFSGHFNDLEPFYTPDGRKIFFTSNRPVNGSNSPKKDYDIWYLQKNGNEWKGPFNLGAPVNTELDEFYPSLAKNGNLYFTRNHQDAGDDIYFSEFRDGEYTLPVALPDEVNSKEDDFNAFVDPDENFLIFSSYRRKDNLGKGDLYYSKRIQGSWQTSAHFTGGINSEALDYSPFVSTDKKFFFFTSKRLLVEFPFPKSKSAAEIRELLAGYGNGFEDIYFMDFETVRKMMK
jgi:Tol biopolymer transport system component